MDHLIQNQIIDREMKYIRFITFITALIFLTGAANSQDVRTVETKVADLLAQMPSKDAGYTDKLMNDILALGDAGIKMICNQVVPSGNGDDTRPRFAIESLSRYLSKGNMENDRARWELVCLDYIATKDDYTVKDFFMKQLQLVGSEKSIDALKGYLNDKNLCAPAVAVIGEVGGQKAETVLSEALKDRNLPCGVAAMHILAGMKSDMAIAEFIAWSNSTDKIVQGAAFSAMAQSGNPQAFSILSKAARNVKYRWEHSGATESLLVYAGATGDRGDIKSMEKICKILIDNCNDRNNIQYKSGALELLTRFRGGDAMPYVITALGSQDKSYRNAALKYSLAVKDQKVTKQLIDFYPKATIEVKPEIIRNLGERKDNQAVPLVKSSLSDPDMAVRMEAAPALVSLTGKESVSSVIEYLVKNNNQGDQEAAKNTLVTVLDGKSVSSLLPALKDAGPLGKKTIIGLLAWSNDKKFFADVVPFAASDDESVRGAAYKAFASLASSADQNKLIELLSGTDNPSYIGDLQVAIASAANQVTDPEKRSATILNALGTFPQKEKLIPVLAMTGGREALSIVLKEFENGSAEMRTVCFKTLTSWKDFSASSALYAICSSGNKNYGTPAFDGYVRQVRTARVSDDQRLLLYRKIMPYAPDRGRRNQVIAELGKIKTYPALFYTSVYLDDPETEAAAAKSIMYIALPPADSKDGMTGQMVREILTKAVPKFKGSESDYDKELVNKYIVSLTDEEGFVPMFNGKDLSGWQGLVENPIARSKMKPADLVKKQAEANKKMLENWSVKDGCIMFSGKGDNLCSIKEYSDFEMLVDWKITKEGDSGIYLRGSPQVQIWDTSRVSVGARVGSGGLYNNQKNPSKPIVVADNPIGEWNTFRIVMIGEKVSVWLNGIVVVDNVIMENYWDRKIPIFAKGPIELQAHGNELAFRDIYVRELNEKLYNLSPEEKAQGFEALFNGRNLDNWIGNKESYVVEDGVIVVKPDKGSGGNLYTQNEYSDFIFRFEFQLTPAANNGLGIRAPLEGDAAYAGMELQILDDTAPVYANLQPYQYHGSVYGVIPARRGYQKPVGEWNYQEVAVKGTQVKITLNGTVIVDGDIAGPGDNGTMDHRDHPGLKNKTGHIGFLGHGSVVKFRNIRIKDISK
jgi:HEAT repeat protein